MFNTKNRQNVDREIELYKREKMLAVDRTVEDYRASQFRSLDEVDKIAVSVGPVNANK